MCLGFKGGTGKASRVIKIKDSTYTVGAIVQSNFGAKRNLSIAGVPVGIALKDTLNYKYNAAPKSKTIRRRWINHSNYSNRCSTSTTSIKKNRTTRSFRSWDFRWPRE